MIKMNKLIKKFNSNHEDVKIVYREERSGYSAKEFWDFMSEVLYEGYVLREDD